MSGKTALPRPGLVPPAGRFFGGVQPHLPPGLLSRQGRTSGSPGCWPGWPSPSSSWSAGIFSPKRKLGRTRGNSSKKTALVYALAVVLYLPLNWYNGGFASPLQGLQKLLLDGTLYPPVVLPGGPPGGGDRAESGPAPRPHRPVPGRPPLSGGRGSVTAIMALQPAVPGAEKPMYGGIFLVFSYTRNGLFFAPLFLLLGGGGAPVEPSDLRRGVRPVPSGDEPGGILAPGPRLAPPRQHVPASPPVHGLSVLPPLGGKTGARTSGPGGCPCWSISSPWSIVLVRGGA